MIGFGIFRETDESKMIPNILTKAILRMELPLTEELVCGESQMFSYGHFMFDMTFK